jgi:DNA processing protein
MTAVDGSGAATAVADEERLARAGLTRCAEPGDALIAREIDATGVVATWRRLQRSVPAVDPRRDLDNAAALGGRFICPGDGEWPRGLADLAGGAGGEAGAPFGLWVRGRMPVSVVVERSVALVGSRAATSYGLHVAGEMALDLAAAGWTVVSGGAFGIDGAAHRGALVGTGTGTGDGPGRLDEQDPEPARTVAVLAGGVDVPYPKAHTGLLQRIVDEGGLLISEAPPGTPPLRRRFLVRNRIIAALAAGTVVVEAGVRSGALNSARHARRIGRHVLAVPGPVTSGLSVGCHLLLRQWPEAQLVTSAAEVIEAVGRVGELAPLPPSPPGPRDGLEPLMHRVLDAVPSRRPRSAAEIADRCGEAEEVVALVLQPLLAAGLVERKPGGFTLTDLGRRPSGAAHLPPT